VTTQPSLIAMMVSPLGLTGDKQVLEVGTGYGWQTALLARLAA
jgi:protein-L-isoaspartate(D-aspartate) O-methyltransferase